MANMSGLRRTRITQIMRIIVSYCVTNGMIQMCQICTDQMLKMLNIVERYV